MNEVSTRLAEELEKFKLRLAGQMNACAKEGEWLFAKAGTEPLAGLRLAYGGEARKDMLANCTVLRTLDPSSRETAVRHIRAVEATEDNPLQKSSNN
jgi:hypothetical protein